MEKSKLISYALWFGQNSLSEEKIEISLSKLWEDMWTHWRFPASIMIEAFPLDDIYGEFIKPWIKVAPGLYFLHIESKWSPSDLSEYFNNFYSFEKIEMLVAKIDQNSEMIHQCLLSDPEHVSDFDKWQEQSKKLCLVRRKTPEELSETFSLELEISNLEKEVGFAIFPVTRESFESAWKYRCYLEQIQAEKNANSEIWQRMKNWN